MHHKYMLIASSMELDRFKIQEFLDQHRIGQQPVGRTRKFNIKSAAREWKNTVAPFAHVNGKVYFYENIPSHITEMKDGIPSVRQISFTSIQRDPLGGNEYDRLTLYGEDGKVIYPINVPMSTVIDFKDFMKYTYDIDVYTNAELARLTNRPANFIRDLGDGKYRSTGYVPYVPYFNDYHLMTAKEIEEELSLDFNTQETGVIKERMMNIPLKGFQRESFTAWGYYNNAIDQHSHAVINSLGYTIDPSEWQILINRIMDQHEELVMELGLSTYMGDKKTEYLEKLPKYEKLHDWVERLLAVGYPVFEYGDYIQLLPFIHLTDINGEFSNPFSEVEFGLPFRCTSFVRLESRENRQFMSDGLNDRTHPNFLNRLSIYKKYMPAKYFCILRYF